MSSTGIPIFLNRLNGLYQDHRGPILCSDKPTNLFLIPMGTTGCGSSTLINRLIESSARPNQALMQVGKGTLSCTQNVQWAGLVSQPDQSTEYTRKYNISIMDVPGFNRDSTIDQLTDHKILKKIWKGLYEKAKRPNEPFRLGVLLLKDIKVDKESPADVAFIKSAISPTVLKQSIIVTTKWPSPEEARDQSENVTVLEDRQDQMRRSLTPLLDSDAGSVLSACKNQGDEWRIIHDLVARVDACNCVIYPESLTPLFASRMKRFLKRIKAMFRTASSNAQAPSTV